MKQTKLPLLITAVWVHPYGATTGSERSEVFRRYLPSLNTLEAPAAFKTDSCYLSRAPSNRQIPTVEP
jgi:hypothetical protein